MNEDVKKVERRKPIGFYSYTVVLTYVGMLTGFVGIICAVSGNAKAALLCLMMAGFCDMFDGAVASTKKNRTVDEKCFGIQIDSLSDLICFGVLPALTVCFIDDDQFVPSYVVGGLFVLCALIRLAFYNVDEANRQRVQAGPREFFLGLPVTSIALSLPLFTAIAYHTKADPQLLGMAVLFVTGILFITPFRLRKPQKVGKIIMIVFGAAIVGCVLFLLKK